MKYLLILTLLTGCLAKTKEKDNYQPAASSGGGSTTTTTPPDPLAAFVGTWSTCIVVVGKGTDFPAASSFTSQITINADGTYTHYRWYVAGVNNCLGGQNVISWY